jgi:hypothetical protein
MADVDARKAAIKKASSQVRSGGVSVRRSTAGQFPPGRPATTMTVRSSSAANTSKKSH